MVRRGLSLCLRRQLCPGALVRVHAWLGWRTLAYSLPRSSRSVFPACRVLACCPLTNADLLSPQVKAKGEPSCLYSKGRILGYKRSKVNQYENTSLIKIEHVNQRSDTDFYLGKR